MIIDFHTHIFPDKIAKSALMGMSEKSGLHPQFDGTAQGLLESMNKNAVDISVILPVVTRPKQFQSVNSFAALINEQNAKSQGARLISFGGIHPESKDYKNELKEIVNLGLKGIKLHPDYQGTRIEDIRYMRIIDYAGSLGLITSIHAGIDIGYQEDVHCTVKGIVKLIKEVHPKNLVLAHFGGYGLWDEVEESLVGEEVYLDTGFIFHAIEKKQFLRIVRAHGSERVLFATDCPWSSQADSLVSLDQMGLSNEEAENILFRNACKLLKL